MKTRLIKNRCEIDGCGMTDPNALHLHHIIERTEQNTTNHNYNLAIICANHHELVHAGRLRIIGVYPATIPPNNRILVYELDGKRNVEGIDVPMVSFKNKSFAI
jgi:hypothetical protein